MTLRISQTFFESIFAHIYNDLQKHKCDQKKKTAKKDEKHVPVCCQYIQCIYKHILDHYSRKTK